MTTRETPTVRPTPAPAVSLWPWRCLAVALCALHAYVARHTMNPDGVSYLDIADACAQGHWAACLNPYWSPLYPWLLAGALTLLHPSAYWECAVVHGVNFLLFLGALAAFEFFLRECLRARRETEADDGQPLPGWALAGISYAVFAWICRRLVTVSFVTPDMGVAALVLLASAWTLRLRRLGPTPARSVALGATLGTAYLAKTVMFPLSFAFLAASTFSVVGWRRGLRHLAAAGVAFTLIAGSFIAALSLSRGYFTYGDSGKLNYAWYVGGLSRPHAPADAGPAGRPAHPPRQLQEAPAVYEFAAPVGGTYPLWYDPAYWYEGVRPAVGLSAQLRALARTAASYFTLLGEQLLGLTGAVTLLCLFTLRGPGRFLRRLAGQFPILLPAIAAVGLYSLVGHVEGRLIGPFLVLAVVGILAALRIPAGQEAATGRLAAACLAVVVALLGVNIVFDAGNAATALAHGEGPAAHPDWQAACVLRNQGLRPGDGVAFVGFTFDAYWARLGGYRIVAEVPETEAERFWAEDGPRRVAVLEAFRQAGARAVVVRHTPGSDWKPVPRTAFAFRMLAPPPPVVARSGDRATGPTEGLPILAGDLFPASQAELGHEKITQTGLLPSEGLGYTGPFAPQPVADTQRPRAAATDTHARHRPASQEAR